MSKPPDDGETGLVVPPTINPTPPATSVSGADPSIIKEFLNLAQKEIEVRQEEIALQKQDHANAHEFAKQSLEAQADDRKDARASSRGSNRDRMFFAGIVIVLLLAFLVAAMYLGQGEIAKEVVKDIGFVIAGGFGGYTYAMQKARKKKDEG